MRQFLLPGEVKPHSSIIVRGKAYHYLQRVLRLKPGDTFQGIDKSGSAYTVRLAGADSTGMRLEILSRRDKPAEACAITLLQCLPKGRKMDLIVRMAVETGVREIVPLVSDYTMYNQRELTQARDKVARWQKIAGEAVQQCGRGSVPLVAEPVLLDDMLASREAADVRLVCHQEPVGDGSLHSVLAAGPASVEVLIGPEGGLSGRELRLLTGSGFVPVYLGKNILRTETAAVFMLAAVTIVLLEKGTWNLPQKPQTK
jgi:16S rRNA (uracil1498-N3)-methyltransferase